MRFFGGTKPLERHPHFFKRKLLTYHLMILTCNNGNQHHDRRRPAKPNHMKASKPKLSEPVGAHARVLELFIACPALEAEVANLPAHVEAANANLARLEASVNVDDDVALASVGVAQIKAALLPRRLVAKQDALVKLKADLLEACGHYILTQLGRQARELDAAVVAKTTAELRPHFRTEPELHRAVITSVAVTEVRALCDGARLEVDPIGGVMNYAKRLLELPEQFALRMMELSQSAAA